jgi:hypothetical protein
MILRDNKIVYEYLVVGAYSRSNYTK